MLSPILASGEANPQAFHTPPPSSSDPIGRAEGGGVTPAPSSCLQQTPARFTRTRIFIPAQTRSRTGLFNIVVDGAFIKSGRCPGRGAAGAGVAVYSPARMDYSSSREQDDNELVATLSAPCGRSASFNETIYLAISHAADLALALGIRELIWATSGLSTPSR